MSFDLEQDFFFLAMSDYQGFLGEESPDSCHNVVGFWGVSRDELWNESGSFRCLIVPI